MKLVLALTAAVLLTGCAAVNPPPATAIVRVETPGQECWTANIGMATQEGCGDKDFTVDTLGGIVSANAQKTDDAPWLLEISVYLDGNVRATNSTSAGFGVAQVAVNLA